MTLDTYIPIAEAEAIYCLSNDQLHLWIQCNKIRAVMTNSGVMVNMLDISNQLPKEDRPEYKAVAHLKGIPIGINEGARKYGVQNSSISRWVTKGYIVVLGKKPVHGGYQKLIDEADLAYCIEIYRQMSRSGKKLFNPDGTPHHK